jgi:hypothetical protein
LYPSAEFFASGKTPQSPVFAALPQKCAQIFKNLRNVELLL